MDPGRVRQSKNWGEHQRESEMFEGKYNIHSEMLILAKSSYLQQQFRAKQIRADLTQEN